MEGVVGDDVCKSWRGVVVQAKEIGNVWRRWIWFGRRIIDTEAAFRGKHVVSGDVNISVWTGGFEECFGQSIPVGLVIHQIEALAEINVLL